MIRGTMSGATICQPSPSSRRFCAATYQDAAATGRKAGRELLFRGSRGRPDLSVNMALLDWTAGVIAAAAFLRVCGLIAAGEAQSRKPQAESARAAGDRTAAPSNAGDNSAAGITSPDRATIVA